MSKITTYQHYIETMLSGCRSPTDGIDKRVRTDYHIFQMLNRTQSMFKWEGLPDSIPQRNLEIMLQCNGNVCIYEYEGKLYAFTGGMGGEPDVYYNPTIYTFANPALGISRELRIGTECEIIRNDSMLTGMLPLFYRYASALTETEVSIDVATVNSRLIDLVSASDDRTRESALKFFADLREGKPGVIAENAFLAGIKAQPYGTTGNRSITDLIELNQYQKASFWNDIGLNANYNMKRESINSGESQLNDDALLPLIDDLLRERQEGCDRVNAMYGTSMSVSLASAWEDNEQEIEAEQDSIQMENEPEEQGESVNDDSNAE